MIEERELQALLRPLGLGIRPIPPDGHCLYRSLGGFSFGWLISVVKFGWVRPIPPDSHCLYRSSVSVPPAGFSCLLVHSGCVRPIPPDGLYRSLGECATNWVRLMAGAIWLRCPIPPDRSLPGG